MDEHRPQIVLSQVVFSNYNNRKVVEKFGLPDVSAIQGHQREFGNLP